MLIRAGASVIRLDMMHHPFTAARARNEGFVALKRFRPNVQFVQFVDGDSELVSGWLDAALPFIARHNDIAVVCGRRRERHLGDAASNRMSRSGKLQPAAGIRWCA
jgi:cellulose synthase/poly-beta-1,6-N-acetylglucosamine synthase-like glycosyltransferase